MRANPGGDGFFRTLLPPDQRRALLTEVEVPLERFVTLDDTWFAVMAGHTPPEEILATIAELAEAGESDPSVWRRATSVLAELNRLLSDTQRTKFEPWVRSTLGDTLEAFPPLECTDRSAEVAATLMVTLGVAGVDPAARDLARSVFDGEHPEIHSAVGAASLEVISHDPDDDRYAEIRRRWKEASNPQDEQRHLGALVATIHPEQFHSALTLCLGDIRSQDAPYVLRRALSNRVRGTDAWDFVVDNWNALSERLPSGSLPRMLEGIRGFTDEWTSLAVERFLGDHTLPTGERQVAQHLERMQSSVAIAARIHTWDLA
ncbi:MAG: ERAP1-like C-terminal domain-containing protein [Microthrixaceae bacterium]|nr:ERAP1-like C-terminal domain-containing protein [Microthrixaceae bacterium]